MCIQYIEYYTRKVIYLNHFLYSRIKTTSQQIHTTVHGNIYRRRPEIGPNKAHRPRAGAQGLVHWWNEGNGKTLLFVY